MGKQENPGRYDHFKWKNSGAGKAGHVNIDNDIDSFNSYSGYASFGSSHRGDTYGYTNEMSFKTYYAYESAEILEVELYLYQPDGGGSSDVLASDSIIVKDFHDEPRPFFWNS